MTPDQIGVRCPKCRDVVVAAHVDQGRGAYAVVMLEPLPDPAGAYWFLPGRYATNWAGVTRCEVARDDTPPMFDTGEHRYRVHWCNQ
jgi:hypothetical protein